MRPLLNKVRSIALGFALLSVLAPASASVNLRYSAYVTSSPDFVYDMATKEHPLIVEAETEDNRCQFTVAFWAAPEDASMEGLMRGIVESGTCGDKEIVKGKAAASTVNFGDTSRLNRYIDVLIVQ